MNDVQLVLTKARNLVSEGWCKFEAKIVKDGRIWFCASGAIHHASMEVLASDKDLHGRALRVFHDTLPSIGVQQSISHWNDFYTTTKKDVLQKFDEAIEEAAQV